MRDNSVKKELQMNTNMDIFQIILQSGFVVKTVLILLILASILSWSIIFSKFKLFKSIKILDASFYKYFKQHTSLNEIGTQAREFSVSPIAMMFIRGQEELIQLSSKFQGRKDEFKEYYSEHGSTALNRAIGKGMLEANLMMENKLATLASISSVTPFVGLFGTVWGIIDSFRGLSTGGGSIESVAPGIAEALVATAVGLAAAIPANWFYNIFASKMTEINNEMESFSQEFLNLADRSVLLKREE
jgi:biopolymer transport protein TolQ